MSERYVCWDHDNDEDPGPVPSPHHVVEDYDVEGAAEEYAERCYSNSAEWAGRYAINVRDSAGVVRVVDVEAEVVPSFSGSIREP